MQKKDIMKQYEKMVEFNSKEKEIPREWWNEEYENKKENYECKNGKVYYQDAGYNREVPTLTIEQEKATQNFLASKFGTKENIVSAYEQAQQMLNDVLPQDYEQYDGPEME